LRCIGCPPETQHWDSHDTRGAKTIHTRLPKAHDEPQAAELYEQIGRLKVELEWLKKKVAENS